jgi:hypothetical protein
MPDGDPRTGVIRWRPTRGYLFLAGLSAQAACEPDRTERAPCGIGFAAVPLGKPGAPAPEGAIANP